jgi:hypothetical protein
MRGAWSVNSRLSEVRDRSQSTPEGSTRSRSVLEWHVNKDQALWGRITPSFARLTSMTAMWWRHRPHGHYLLPSLLPALDADI